MTGFGTATADLDGARYAVEIRSVNNKFFKAMVRAPEELQGLEPEIETVLARRLNRGSVVTTIRFSDASEQAMGQINPSAIQHYLDQLRAVPQLAGDGMPIDIGALLSLPGVVTDGAGEQRLENARQVLLKLTGVACDQVRTMRIREGELLERELLRQCDVISEHLAVIVQRVPDVVAQYQQRLRPRCAKRTSSARSRCTPSAPMSPRKSPASRGTWSSSRRSSRLRESSRSGGRSIS
jgi:uncharacterized protein (TIGR00255 family)